MTAWPSLYITNTVVASPAAAAETIIATVPVTTDGAVPILIVGWAALIVGTNGTAVTLRVRPDSATGTPSTSTGAIPAAAGTPVAIPILASFSASEMGARSFNLTAQITAGSATSTVSAVCLACIPQF